MAIGVCVLVLRAVLLAVTMNTSKIMMRSLCGFVFAIPCG